MIHSLFIAPYPVNYLFYSVTMLAHCNADSSAKAAQAAAAGSACKLVNPWL